MNITAGKYKGQKITAPDENITRPTLSKVRMAVFNTLQAIIDFDNASFLDMFAGSGIMGLEALSRGFKSVTAIEKNTKTIKILEDNYKKIGEKQNLIKGDSLKSTPQEYFDVVYIDPPYYAGVYKQALAVLPDCTSPMIRPLRSRGLSNASLGLPRQFIMSGKVTSSSILMLIRLMEE